MEQIEQLEIQRAIPAPRQRRLERRKARRAVLLERHQFAVHQRRLGTQPRDRARHGGQTIGPVEAIAREQAHLAVIEPAQQAIAVELDLADPALALGRLVGDRSQLRRLPLRQLGAHRTLGRSILAWLPRLPRRRRLLFDRGRIGAFALRLVVALDQQPVVLTAALTGTRLQAHQRKAPVQPLAVEHEPKLALAHALVGIVQRLPCAAIPQLHRAGAILAVGYDALEIGIVQRMVLDVRSDPLVGGIERRPFAHRPAPQHAVMLQAEVPVQASAMRLVLLHHEDRRIAFGFPLFRAPARR